MNSETVSISYPSLVESPAAPVIQLTCSACGATFTGGGGALTTLTCLHRVHGECYLKLAQRFNTSQVGGKRHCKHCSVNVVADDAGTTGNRLTREACLEEMRAAYVKAHKLDLDALCDSDVTDADMLVLLGPLERDESLQHGLLRRFGWDAAAPAAPDSSSSSSSGSGSKKAKTLEEERQRLLALRGDELIDELRRRGRSLNVLLETWKVNVAHLWRVGVRSIEQLGRLGFDVGVHTANAYHRVLPLYFLIERYDLDYDRHLSPALLTNEQFLAMQLTKQELRLLNVTADMLLEERHFYKRELFALHIRPSSLHDYIELSETQLLSALYPPLTADDFRDNMQWNNDRRENAFACAVFEAVKTRAREQKK